MESYQRPTHTDRPLSLMERVDRALSHYRYADGTCHAYRRWIMEYVQHLRVNKIPQERFTDEVNVFLSAIREERQLSEASSRQALNAISFLYNRVFDVPLDALVTPVKQRTESPVPEIITPEQVAALLARMKGKHRLMAGLLYGTGIRLTECIRLRVKHLDFDRMTILVSSQSSDKTRTVILPQALKGPLLEQLEMIRALHQQDMAQGAGGVPEPSDSQKPLTGNAQDFSLQFVFPAKNMKPDPKTNQLYRPCVAGSGLQKAVAVAAGRCQLSQKVSCRTLRHCFAAHLLENGTDIFELQRLMGHADIKQTLIYREVMNPEARIIKSPLDRIAHTIED